MSLALDLQRASERAAKLYTSDNLRNAYVRGARAALDGRRADECPYEIEKPPPRSRRRRTTWRTTYRLAWLRGHQSIPRNEPN